MNAQLLCAGLGTRFRPITDKIAKPAIPFLNLPQIAYSLIYLESLKLENLVINTHHLPKTVEAAARAIAAPNYKLHFSHEPKILGSGGGVKNNSSVLTGDPIVVVNGDEIILFSHPNGFQPLVEFHKSRGALATLLTTKHPEAGRSLGGIWADSTGAITKLGGTDLATADSAQHFIGVFVFSSRIFKYMPAAATDFHIFKDFLQPAIAAGEKVLSYFDPNLLWYETTDTATYLESTRSALEMLSRDTVHAKHLLAIMNRFGHKYERLGEAQWVARGAFFDPFAVSGSYLLLGEDSSIGEGTEVRGFAVMGNNARFQQGILDSSVIAPGVHINEMITLRQQVVV